MLQGFSVITLLRIWSNYFAAKQLFHFRLAMSYYLKHTFRNCESWQDLCLSLSFFAPKRIWKELEVFGGKSTFTSHLESQEVWAKAKLILKIDQTPLNGHLRLSMRRSLLIGEVTVFRRSIDMISVGLGLSQFQVKIKINLNVFYAIFIDKKMQNIESRVEIWRHIREKHFLIPKIYYTFLQLPDDWNFRKYGVVYFQIHLTEGVNVSQWTLIHATTPTVSPHIKFGICNIAHSLFSRDR